MILFYIYNIHPWDHSSCDGSQHLRVFYSVSLSLALVYMVLMAAIVYTTTRGTLINQWPRRRMAPLIKAKLVFDITRLSFTAWCVNVAYFEDMTNCDAVLVRGMMYTVHLSWVVNVGAVFAFPYLFCPLFDKPKKQQAKRLRRTNSFKEDINTIARGYQRSIAKR